MSDIPNTLSMAHSLSSQSFFSFANFISRQLTLDNPRTRHFITGKGDSHNSFALTEQKLTSLSQAELGVSRWVTTGAAATCDRQAGLTAARQLPVFTPIRRVAVHIQQQLNLF